MLTGGQEDDAGLQVKKRKPYTITKQRERWTDDEHARFLEALRLHGRAWRRIEEHVGTKTAVQIRSHAQKFFSKLERQKEAGTQGEDVIDIPPPRPKRKPTRPYPRKDPSQTGGGPSSKPSNGTGLNGSYMPSGIDLLADVGTDGYYQGGEYDCADEEDGVEDQPGPHHHHHYRHYHHHRSHHTGGHRRRGHGDTDNGGRTAEDASTLHTNSSAPPNGLMDDRRGSGSQSMDGTGGETQTGDDDVSEATIAAVAAAASAAAAAAAAAVIAAAGQQVQAHMQANPPKGFPFFGQTMPARLAHLSLGVTQPGLEYLHHNALPLGPGPLLPQLAMAPGLGAAAGPGLNPANVRNWLQNSAGVQELTTVQQAISPPGLGGLPMGPPGPGLDDTSVRETVATNVDSLQPSDTHFTAPQGGNTSTGVQYVSLPHHPATQLMLLGAAGLPLLPGMYPLPASLAAGTTGHGAAPSSSTDLEGGAAPQEGDAHALQADGGTPPGPAGCDGGSACSGDTPPDASEGGRVSSGGAERRPGGSPKAGKRGGVVERPSGSNNPYSKPPYGRRHREPAVSSYTPAAVKTAAPGGAAGGGAGAGVDSVSVKVLRPQPRKHVVTHAGPESQHAGQDGAVAGGKGTAAGPGQEAAGPALGSSARRGSSVWSRPMEWSPSRARGDKPGAANPGSAGHGGSAPWRGADTRSQLAQLEASALGMDPSAPGIADQSSSADEGEPVVRGDAPAGSGGGGVVAAHCTCRTRHAGSEGCRKCDSSVCAASNGAVLCRRGGSGAADGSGDAGGSGDGGGGVSPDTNSSQDGQPGADGSGGSAGLQGSGNDGSGGNSTRLASHVASRGADGGNGTGSGSGGERGSGGDGSGNAHAMGLRGASQHAGHHAGHTVGHANDANNASSRPPAHLRAAGLGSHLMHAALQAAPVAATHEATVSAGSEWARGLGPSGLWAAAGADQGALWGELRAAGYLPPAPGSPRGDPADPAAASVTASDGSLRIVPLIAPIAGAAGATGAVSHPSRTAHAHATADPQMAALMAQLANEASTPYLAFSPLQQQLAWLGMVRTAWGGPGSGPRPGTSAGAVPTSGLTTSPEALAQGSGGPQQKPPAQLPSSGQGSGSAGSAGRRSDGALARSHGTKHARTTSSGSRGLAANSIGSKRVKGESDTAAQGTTGLELQAVEGLQQLTRVPQ